MTHPFTRRAFLRGLGLGGLGLTAPNLFTGCSNSDTPGAGPSSYTTTILTGRKAIQNALAAADGPSAVTVALVDPQRILWSEAFGLIDRERGLAPTPEIRFGIASVSKIITTVAAMILVDRGLVELDAPLVAYVPQFRMQAREDYGAISLRLLLNHASGLPGFEYRNAVTVIPLDGYSEQLLDTLATQRLKYAPGETASYCNDGFNLIPPLISAVTGETYAAFVTREILEPLGMGHTLFPLIPLTPGSYAPLFDAQGKALPQEFANCYPSGGIYSTAADMGRLAMLFLNQGRVGDRPLLSAWAVTEMGRDQSAALPLNPLHTIDYGLGWDSVREGGLAAVGVTAWYKGGDTGYHCRFLVAPEEGLGVVVITAAGEAYPLALAERILLQALVDQGSIAAYPAPLEPEVPPCMAASDAALAAMAGIYANYSSLVRFATNPDRTLSRATFQAGTWGQDPAPWRLHGDGWWRMEGQAYPAYQVVPADGRRYLAQRLPSDGADHFDLVEIFGHDLEVGGELSPPWLARLKERWLLVNDPVFSSRADGSFQPVCTLARVEGLHGYVAVSPAVPAAQVIDTRDSDTTGFMCLKVPGNGGRDLNDLVCESVGDEEWLRFGSYRYRPLSGVPELGPGEHPLAIGAEGLGEWRRLPAAATLTVTGASAWYLYDPDFALLACVIAGQTLRGLDTQVPAGGFLLLHGAAFDSLQVIIA